MIGPGRFVLVVGPSGAGKDTLIAAAKAHCLDHPRIVFPRRVVTRPATVTEDHDSLTENDFDTAIRNRDFAFWWQAHGLRYGVPRHVDDDIRLGCTVVCNLSRGTVGAVQARYAHVNTVMIIAPPEILAARLAARSRRTDGSHAQRLRRNEAYADFTADTVIENIGETATAVQALLDVIRK